jgi:hypothetical protein
MGLHNVGARPHLGSRNLSLGRYLPVADGGGLGFTAAADTRL